jgi:hypothetical protein
VAFESIVGSILLFCILQQQGTVAMVFAGGGRMGAGRQDMFLSLILFLPFLSQQVA